jgi:polyhydroxyalkanoate synthesis regulator protein
MIAFSKEQERFREQMKGAFGKAPIDMMKTPMKALEEQTRRNVEMFQNAMRMFTPFPAASTGAAAPAETPKKEEKGDDLQELKAQIAAMQRKLDTMS